MDTLGEIVLWVIAVALISALPITELARGMASNPSEHELSRKAAIISVVGLLMALWLFMYT